MTFKDLCMTQIFPHFTPSTWKKLNFFSSSSLTPDNTNITEEHLNALKKFLKATLSAASVRGEPWTKLIDPQDAYKENLIQARQHIQQEQKQHPAFAKENIEPAVHTLQEFCKKEKARIFLIPKSDPFQNEYGPDCYNYLHFITGFSGSAGFSFITPDNGFLFVDGRYTLQAQEEAHALFQQRSYTRSHILEAIKENTQKGDLVLFDPWYHTAHDIKNFQKDLPHLIFKALEENPIEKLWQTRPEEPVSPIIIQTEDYAGESVATKCQKLTQKLEEHQAEYLILTAPDDIAWLTNTRGFDIDCCPMSLAFAIYHKKGIIDLFINPIKVPDDSQLHKHPLIHLNPIQDFEKHLKTLSQKNVLIDLNQASFFISHLLSSHKAPLTHLPSPITQLKALKNKVELDGMRSAHIRDGAKVTEFLYTLQTCNLENITEKEAADLLFNIRAKDPTFLMPSFSTISASGPHAALCHYSVSEESNRPLHDAVYLVDSGGQYPDGTTDITRTIALKDVSSEVKKNFTLVLKGHISLATSIFPEGTCGAHLDALARQHLWQYGLDYAHGTGHGVGAFLNVHEGPQNISKRLINTPLKAGMILSNEPGYYKENEYGIRIENLVIVVPSQSFNGFYEFETITLAPIDLNMVDPSYLAKHEIEWLNQYHKRVYNTLSPMLDDNIKVWLQNATQEISV